MIPINVVELYEYAEHRGYDVYWYSFDTDQVPCVSVPLPDGSCAIALDPYQLKSLADEKYKIGHELGHCETGSFYSRSVSQKERTRAEVRADRWTIKKLLPFEEMEAAIAQGNTEIYELADYFTLPEDLIRQAIDYYTGPCGLTFSS